MIQMMAVEALGYTSASMSGAQARSALTLLQNLFSKYGARVVA